MGKLKDKLAGTAKQAVAELTGDGKLAAEGREQVKKGQQGKNGPAIKPAGNLDELT